VLFFTTEACGQASTEGTEFHRDGLWHVSIDCRESLQAYGTENAYGGHRPAFRQAVADVPKFARWHVIRPLVKITTISVHLFVSDILPGE
jgi:hypothetical protein